MVIIEMNILKIKVSTLQIANEKFAEKDYAAALELYEKFEKDNPSISHLARSNINLINKKISIASNEKSSVNILNLHFSKIYVVNMAHSTAEKEKISNHLNSRRIEWQLWRGTDGYKGEPLNFYEKYSKKPLGKLKRYPDMNEREIWRKKHYIESPGAIGYIYTYSGIIRDAINRGYKKILILEDDIILDNDFEVKFSKFMKAISSDWKVVQLGASQYDWSSVNDEEAKKAGFYYPKRIHTCGSFAIGLNLDVLNNLDEAINCFESPFDLLPLGEIYDKYKERCFVCYPNIVMPDVTTSNIRGGRNQYEHASKMRWSIENFEFPLSKPHINFILADVNSYKKAVDLRMFLADHYDISINYYSIDGIRPLHFELGDEDDLNLLKNEDIFSGSNKFSNFIEINSRIPLSVDSLILEINKNISEKNSKQNSTTGQKVSVIIPTYKRTLGLKASAVSVLNQDYGDLELIIVDDNGSSATDGEAVELIVAQLKHDFPRRSIKLLKHRKNRNGAAARNTGFNASTGDYICFLDDDDLYLDGRISKTVRTLQNTPPTIGASYCGFLGWNSSENDVNRYPEGDLGVELILLNYKSHYIHTNTVTYKRHALERINGFDESFRRHQDIELNFRFFQKFKILATKEALVKLKVNPQDIDNRQVGVSFYKTKKRFLDKFKIYIRQLDQITQYQLYSAHAAEVKRLVSQSDLTDFCGANHEAGFLVGCIKA